MEEIFLYLIVSCLIIFFVMLTILGIDKWVLLYKIDFGSFDRGPIPPRTMLNDFGKIVLAVWYISAAFMIVLIIIAFLLALN